MNIEWSESVRGAADSTVYFVGRIGGEPDAHITIKAPEKVALELRSRLFRPLSESACSCPVLAGVEPRPNHKLVCPDCGRVK